MKIRRFQLAWFVLSTAFASHVSAQPRAGAGVDAETPAETANGPTSRGPSSSTTPPSPTEAAESAPPGPEATPPPSSVEARPSDERTPGARARLAVWQTLFGGAMGVEVCVLAECSTARGAVGSVLIGMGAGVTASVLATRRHGVRSGSAMLYDTAPIVGTFLAFNVFRATARRDLSSTTGILSDTHDYLHPRNALATVLAGQIGSYGLAYGIDRWLAPSTGETTAAVSAGGWLSFYTFLGVNDVRGWTHRDDAFSRRLAGGYLLVSIGGMAGGGLLAHHVDMSSGRAMIINGGGVLGGGLGALLAFFVRTTSITGHGVIWATIGGSAGGMGLTYFLTRKIDRHDTNGAGLGMSFSPVAGGAIAEISGHLR